MTEKLYFACDWLVYPLAGRIIVHAVNTASKLGCYLFAVDTRHDNQGLYFCTWLLQVPSEDVLKEFIAEAGKSMNLVQWYQVDGKDYLELWPIIGPEMMYQVMIGSRAIGEANDKKRHIFRVTE